MVDESTVEEECLERRFCRETKGVLCCIGSLLLRVEFECHVCAMHDVMFARSQTTHELA